MKHAPFVQVNLLKEFITKYITTDPAFSEAAQEILKEVDDPGTEDEIKLENAFIEAANSNPMVSDGRLEVDDNAVVSFSEDKGAYVQAWIWVYDSDVDPDIIKLRGYEDEDDEEKDKDTITSD